MKLRLIITIDYEANPSFYGTDDPEVMAQIDYKNLVEGICSPTMWIEQVDEEDINTMRMTYAITPVN